MSDVPIESAERNISVPDSAEFTTTLGQVIWLMGLSEAHRDLPISAIEPRIQAPLMLRQVRVITQGKQPLAAIIWATVSESIEYALDHPDFAMDLPHWRSGDRLVIVDVISPFVAREKIEKLFWDQVNGRLPTKPGPSADGVGTPDETKTNAPNGAQDEIE